MTLMRLATGVQSIVVTPVILKGEAGGPTTSLTCPLTVTAAVNGLGEAVCAMEPDTGPALAPVSRTSTGKLVVDKLKSMKAVDPNEAPGPGRRISTPTGAVMVPPVWLRVVTVYV